MYKRVQEKILVRLTLSATGLHKAITMLLILVEVSVKVVCQSTTATNCSHREVSVEVACQSMTATDSRTGITMLLILVEVSVKVACQSTTATNWQAQSYHHATYSGGSICESGLSVHCINRLQPQS